MATAFAGVATNFKVGNYRVSLGGTDLGYTVDGSVIVIEEEWRDRTGDQDGTTVLDRVKIGENMTISLKLKEFTPANLSKALLGSTLTSAVVEWGGQLAGVKTGYSNALALLLHPLDLDDAVLTGDWNVWKVVPEGKLEIPGRSGEDLVLPITFKALPDTSKARGVRLFKYGA